MCSVSNAPQTHTLTQTHTQPHTLAVSVYFANLEVGTKSANDASDSNRNRMAYRQSWRGSLDTNQYTQQSYRVCPKSRQAGQEASAIPACVVAKVITQSARELGVSSNCALFLMVFLCSDEGRNVWGGERGRYRGLGAGSA